jgi:hypothetical protein
MRKDAEGPTALAEFEHHFAAFEDAGVKYLVVPPGTALPSLPPGQSLREVFSDSSAVIYQLPSPRSMFSVAKNSCGIKDQTLESVTVTCAQPETLVHDELYMNGWSATLNGASVPVTQRGALQQVRVPVGTSVVTFTFTPPYVIFGFVAFLLGLACLIAPLVIRRRRIPAHSKGRS